MLTGCGEKQDLVENDTDKAAGEFVKLVLAAGK